MFSIAMWVAISALILVTANWIYYLLRIPQNKVPDWPYGSITAQFAGIGMSISAMSEMNRDHGLHMASVIIPASLALMMAVFFLWLLAARETPTGDLKVQVGDPLPAFAAITSENAVFESKAFSGRRILLKFFRGGWSPYCCAELLRMDQMKRQLSEFGVTVYALSKDTAEEASIHQSRDGLKMTLLADPELKVIQQFGVEHHKAFGFKTDNFLFFGMPMAFKPSFKTMAIPTTLLIDEHGTIRWIDQAEDYRLRSSEEIILNEVKKHFQPSK